MMSPVGAGGGLQGALVGAGLGQEAPEPVATGTKPQVRLLQAVAGGALDDQPARARDHVPHEVPAGAQHDERFELRLRSGMEQ